ncbi:MAG: two-component regulator propeller domain-containing protein [Pseudomonadota bacterium]
MTMSPDLSDRGVVIVDGSPTLWRAARRLAGPVLVLILALLFAGAAGAARLAPWPHLALPPFQNLGAQNGLSNTIVTNIRQGGLSRWDGYRFRNFVSIPADPRSLPDNYVLTVQGGEQGLPRRRWHALLRDAAGALWLGASDRVMTLAPGGQRFEDRTPRDFGAAEDGWPVALAQNSDGRLIGASDNGLFRAGANGWEHYGGAQGVHFGNGVHALLFDRDGDLWLGFAGRGLVQWQGYRHWENWARAQGVPDDDVWSIWRTRDGALRLGTGHGLAQRRGAGFAADEGAAGSGQWGALAEDGQGDLWAGSFTGELLRRDRRDARSRIVARLPDKIIYRLLFDDAG